MTDPMRFFRRRRNVREIRDVYRHECYTFNYGAGGGGGGGTSSTGDRFATLGSTTWSRSTANKSLWRRLIERLK